MASTIRGTTPTLVFNLPFLASTVKYCEVYFAQEDNLLLTKTYSDCTLSEKKLQLTLSQEDTLKFDDEQRLQIQIRFVFNDDSVNATSIIKAKIGKILKDGEIDVDE